MGYNDENILTEEDDYSDILILKTITDPSQYQQAYRYTINKTRADGSILKARLQRFKTPYGIGVKKSELMKLLESEFRGRRSQKKGYAINLSTPSKMNALYRRLVDMNETNRNCCQRDNKLPRYVDENGYMCINLKDYIKPQLKLLAKKLECKEHQIFSAIYDLLHIMYLENKHKDEE